MKDVLRIKVGDTRPWTFRLFERGVVLLDSEVSLVALTTKLQGSQVRKINSASCTYSSGQAQYAPTTNDVDTAGIYDLEIGVTFTDGTTATWPEDGYLRLEIDEVL